jgi:hypothetical protein
MTENTATTLAMDVLSIVHAQKIPDNVAGASLLNAFAFIMANQISRMALSETDRQTDHITDHVFKTLSEKLPEMIYEIRMSELDKIQEQIAEAESKFGEAPAEIREELEDLRVRTTLYYEARKNKDE